MDKTAQWASNVREVVGESIFSFYSLPDNLRNLKLFKKAILHGHIKYNGVKDGRPVYDVV